MKTRDCRDAVRSYTFHIVLFLPSYNVNLMNVSSAAAKGSSFSFAADALHLLTPDGIQLPVKQRRKLFFLECKFKRNSMNLVTKTRWDTSDAMLWHQRLGLLNQLDLSSLVNVGELKFCEVCTTSKMREVAVPKNTDSRASAVGQLCFSDIQGSLELRRMHGKRYTLSFMDDINRLDMKKSGVLLKFQEFAAEY